MGWLVETKGKKYRFYSTIVDKPISKWMTKKETLRFLFFDRLEKDLELLVNDSHTFPGGWLGKDGCLKHKDDKAVNAAFKTTDSQRKVYENGLKLLSDLGIELSIRCIEENISFSNKNIRDL